MAAGEAHYTLLGYVVSDAPEAALAVALQRLRPQCEVRLSPAGRQDGGRVRYGIELRDGDGSDPAAGTPTIDPWLRIKSALMAQFPADKPHAVSAEERR